MDLNLRFQHPWKVTTSQARDIQQRLRDRVETEDRLDVIQLVAGIDVGFEQRGLITRAAVILLRFPSLEPVEQAVVSVPTNFPYVPGLLSFREVPAVLDAMRRLKQRPDLLLCDGQGVAHPRRFGIACHLGVLTDIPSIGVAKSRLLGSHDEPAVEKGSWVPLLDHQERIGAVLRTRSGVKPLFISSGHRISLVTATKYVLNCTTRFRLPETTRYAHKLASG